MRPTTTTLPRRQILGRSAKQFAACEPTMLATKTVCSAVAVTSHCSVAILPLTRVHAVGADAQNAAVAVDAPAQPVIMVSDAGHTLSIHHAWLVVGRVDTMEDSMQQLHVIQRALSAGQLAEP